MSQPRAFTLKDSYPTQDIQSLPIIDSVVLSDDDIHLLSEIGFLAATQRAVARAQTIFNLLRQLRPSSALPVIGLAMVWLAVNQPEKAINLLESVYFEKEEEQFTISVYRGMALFFGGRPNEGNRVVKKALLAFKFLTVEKASKDFTVSPELIATVKLACNLVGEKFSFGEKFDHAQP